MDQPRTRYVKVGDAYVAYQVLGDGPDDLVWCLGFGGQIDLTWQIPFLNSVLRRLAASRRLILFDRRGSGASDPVPLNAIPTWEEFAEDLTAVLDAVGSQRAAIFGAIDTGSIGLLFAATHPERVSHLIVFTTSARFVVDDDYPIGMPVSVVNDSIAWFEANWGTDHLVRVLFPEADDEARAALGRSLRAAGTPRSVAAQMGYYLRDLDIRRILPLVQVPTLILHLADSSILPSAHGRYLAEHIPGARFVEVPGSGLMGPDFDDLYVEVTEFLTGQRPQLEVDRILTTLLFSDIVGSTEIAASMGDAMWRRTLDEHDRRFREHLQSFGGREVNSAGDGFLATFDGPARAIRCGRAIHKAVTELGVSTRIGVHTGECEVRKGGGYAGLAVHVAARIGSLASPGEILVSGTLKDLVVGSGIEFTDRGAHELRGVPGTWRLYAVAN